MRRIRKHYLSTTFPMDVVTFFPLDLVGRCKLNLSSPRCNRLDLSA